MEIVINQPIVKLNHSGKLVILEFTADITNAQNKLWEEIYEYIEQLKTGLALEEVNKNPEIYAARSFYKQCGKDPNRYRPSAESLRRRLVKNQELYKVNNVVDILNYISIKSGISIGGYNKDEIDGKVIFDIGNSIHAYEGIGRGEINIEYMPVLSDCIGPFGSPTSDSLRTMIDIQSRNVMFVFFCFNPTINLSAYTNETQTLLSNYASADNFKISEQSLKRD